MTAAGCARRTTIGVGVAGVATGTASLLIGKFAVQHTSSAPDDRLVFYPLGAGLLLVGAAALLIGFAAEEKHAPPETQLAAPACSCGAGMSCLAGVCSRACVELQPGSKLWTCGQGYRCTPDFAGCEIDESPDVQMRRRE